MTDYDLVIVGAGSGNMLPTAGINGLRVAIIERDRFGVTCLNRGCIPSKVLVYAADVAETVRHAGRYGISAELVGSDWPAIRDRVFARIDPLSDQALASRRRSGVDVYFGPFRKGRTSRSPSAARMKRTRAETERMSDEESNRTIAAAAAATLSPGRLVRASTMFARSSGEASQVLKR